MPEQAPLEAVETTGIAAEAELGAEPELAALEHEPFEASREEAGDDANDDAHDDHDAHDDDAHDNAEAEVSDEPSPSLEAKLRRLDAGFRAPTHARRPDPEAHDDVDEDPFHGAPAAAETPRRRRIRAIVGVSVGLVALVSAGAVAAAALRGADHSESSAELAGAPAVVAAPPETRPPLAAEGRGSELAAARAITEAPATDPVPSPSAATSDPAKVKAQNRELFEHTKSLLIAGKLDEAVTSSEKLIAADPESALGYLCLGSAYQDLRRMSDARAAYSDCVAHAKNGPVDECAALGGRKR